jgi:hypothetical protein
MIAPLKILLSDGAIRDCVLDVSDSPPWVVALQNVGDQNWPSQRFEARDLFDAIMLLRLELERRGEQLLCCGARIDVFPSGMSRSMSGGRKAYVLRLGYPGRRSDLVDIFDEATAGAVGTVAQQKEFCLRWRDSLKP